MKRIAWFFFMSLMTSVLFAADTSLKPRLLLDHLNVIQAQEMDGDELYFDISVYRANKTVEYIRVPAKPEHFPSQLASKLSKIPLWSAPVKEGETVTLLVSLMESDASIFNPDDLIGIVRLQLKNAGGVLQSRWNMPNQGAGFKKLSKHRTGVKKFNLAGEGAHYEVYLSLER